MIDLVLKWSPRLRPDTIERHREVALKEGAVWWGRLTYTLLGVDGSGPGSTGLASKWLERFTKQLETPADPTYVFLHSVVGGTWRARLLDITTERNKVDGNLVPSYYDAADQHSLWVKLTDFQQCDPSEVIDGYVLARTEVPVRRKGLNNQTPLIVRRRRGG